MRAVVVTDFRFHRAPDGSVVSGIANRGYEFWTRYLEVFHSVQIIGRVADLAPGSAIAVEGPGVSVVALPNYQGVSGFIRNRGAVRRILNELSRQHVAFIVRMPSAFGGLLLRNLMKARYPFGIEVVGDPYDVFGPKAMRHPLRRLLRFSLTRELRSACQSASGVAYVTAVTLQRRYPPGRHSFTTHYSSLTLPPSAFARRSLHWNSVPVPLRVVCVGRFAQTYKGQDILVEAVAALALRGWPVKLTFVGDGSRRRKVEAQASSLGIASSISFVGEVADPAVIRSILDKNDLFVLPSLTEGLPRVLIEAMARALPAVATDVGGVHELLPPEDLVPPGDPARLSDKIEELVSDVGRLNSASARNLSRAQAFSEAELSKRRVAFYTAIADATRSHLSSKGIK